MNGCQTEGVWTLGPGPRAPPPPAGPLPESGAEPENVNKKQDYIMYSDFDALATIFLMNPMSAVLFSGSLVLSAVTKR